MKDLNFENENISNSNNHNEDVRTMPASMTASLFEATQETEDGVTSAPMTAITPSNQETETAAMLATTPTKPTKNTTQTVTKPTKAENSDRIDAAAVFALPASPKATTTSSGGSRSSSLKKKRRNKDVQSNVREEARNHVATADMPLSIGDMMKTSHSMTSLPPDEEQQERHDVIKAKLSLERPYNSLKKCAHTSVAGKNNKLHRYSWGSHSSSTSLHSSATLGLGTSGKDDLWAAIQTNYNYIMDTNLLDTCKEARYEIEGAATVLEKSTDSSLKLLDETQRSDGLYEDPKELRRWLRDMESKLESVPTISELTMLSTLELQRHHIQHSVLYDEIVSHARVVSTCIRAASEREQQQQLQLLQHKPQQQQQHPRQPQQQQPASLTSEYSSFSTEQNTLSLSSNDEAITKTRNSSSSSSSGINSAEGLQSKSASASTPFTHHHLSNIGAGTEAAIVSAQNNNKKGEGSLERLRTRYYLLYLKAFEVQLCLDNLLSKRTSTANGLDDATDDEEEEDIDSYECDGAATEDDLNEVVSDLDLENEFATQNSSSVADLQRCSVEQQVDSIAPKPDCDDGDDEHEDEEEEGADVVDTVISKHSWRNSCYNSVLLSHSGDKKLGNTSRECTTATLTDFEADSESSDFEFVQQLRRQRKVANEYRYALQQQQQAQKVAAIACVRNFTTTKISSAFLTSHIETRTHVPKLISTQQNEEIHAHLYTNNIAESNNFVALNQASSIETASAAQLQNKRVFEQQQHNTNSSNNNNSHLRSYTATIQPAQPMLQTRIQNKNNSKMLSTQNQVPTKQKNIAVISPNTHTSHNHSHSNKSSPVLRKRQQQQQQRFSDISKFNRSNRKSKNCAIFYFKHLDTDNETNFGGNDSTSNVGDSNDGNDADDNDVVVSHSSNVSSGGVEGEHRCGNGALSSSGASHASDILKSAETSSEDDDEGWLYTANTTGNSDCLNATVVAVDSLQSATVSSTTSTTTATGSSSATSSATFVATSATKSSASQLYDDSDKENKEALAATTATIISTVTIETSSPVIIKSNNSSNNNDSNNCESSNNSTLNGLQAETSATTTTTTQIQHKEEMDLEINGNSTTNNVRNKNKTKSISNNSYIHLNNNNDDICNYGNNNNDSNQQQQQSCVDMTQNDVVDKKNYTQTTCARVDVCNINVKSGNMQHQQQQQQQHMLLLSPGKRLPPRSPAKSVKSTTSSNTTMSPSKGIVSHESIKQLVLEAEHLVRDNQDATLKTPTKQKHSIMKVSSTVKKREGYVPHPIKQRVQEWLEHQPSASQQTSKSQETVNCAVVGGNRADDCEASGEASETDSVPRQGSDTSEGFTDSIATCMQTSTNSYGNSTELIGGSAEPISGATVTTPLGGGSSSNQSLNVSKIIKRPQTRRKSDRPWSVSCLSQLTTDTVQLNTTVTSSADVQAGLAAHSISESALDSLSPGRPRATSSSTTATTTLHARKYDSKGSLRRRRTRKKRLSLASAGKKTDSGSEEHTDLPIFALMKSCEAMTPTQIQDITSALLNLQNQQQGMVGEQAPLSPTKDLQTGAQMSQLPLTESGEEESQLMKPNFRVGSYTTAYMANEAARLGSLAALASYMHDDEQQGEISNEEHHSSFSETAWDNYQEKYNSENYSEGFDSDAARRLMEFGDDYRNFIDSQSDCCSSLSAANNLDSFSPPRMDSLQKHELKVLNINQDTITSSVDHARRRRTLELEYERRRKTLEVRRKSCQEGTVEVTQQLPNAGQQQQRSPTGTLSSSTSVITPKNTMDRHHQAHKVDSATRKLEFGSVGHISHSAQSLPRRTSESDTSTRRRRNGANADDRRRSSRNLEKCIKMLPVANNNSSSSCDDTDDEKEMRNLLQQSRNRLEDTRALKIRCHLLRPEDYHEIINTCRDNIRCLEAVLRGPPGSVLSAQCAAQTKDLLAIWEDLLGWSENAAAARKMQEEMIVLKHSLNRLSNKSTPELLDTEPAIQIAIEALKNEKLQLQSYRTSMLRLNATVHSWLTRQERRLQAALVEQQIKEAAERIASEEAESEQNTTSKIQKQNQAQSQATQITAITVTDSNGNQVEAHSLSNVNTVASDTTMQAKEAGTVTMKSASTSAGAENIWDIQTLMKAEQEFHKHLKDEVSDMYSAWDEADARINTQLEGLTNSLIAWRQLECGLSEFHQALGQDRGTLKGLEGALVKGQATPVELAQNVKLVAKLLSEKVNVSQEQLIAVHEHLDPNHIYHIAKFTASNGSLSDSGISDGGATSDGGLSERERRLGVLRRLAKQLESALAPGSEAMKSIAARMESAEAELKTLQITCRDLIVRTAATHHSKKLLQQQDDQTVKMAVEMNHNGDITLKPAKGNGCLVAQKQHATNTQSKRKNKNKQRKTFANDTTNDGSDGSSTLRKSNTTTLKSGAVTTNGDGGSDPDDDPPLEFDMENSSDADSGDDTDEKRRRRGWAWRIAKVAVPMQLALFTVFCAACFMQPNCCDNLNNLSMSFTPQLRYIRGPPPI